MLAWVSVLSKDAVIEQINLCAAAGTGNEFHPKVVEHIYRTVMFSLCFIVRFDSMAHVPFNRLESLAHFRDVVRAQRILDDKV
jgi:hypothetical protein